MAANTTPIFALTPKTVLAPCTAAYTDRTGATAGLVDLITASTDGTKITQIGVKFQGTSVASTLLIFITDTTGANPRLFDEITITAVTASNTAASFRNVLFYSDLNLQSGQVIKVGLTALSGSVAANAFCVGGDF